MKKENCLILNGERFEISDDLVKNLKSALEKDGRSPLGEKEIGSIAKIGDYEFIVLDHKGGNTRLLLKDLYVKSMAFGSKNNDYRESEVIKVCREFAKKIETLVGSENVVEHTVDLTSDDGLRDYGTIREKASLLTTDLYRAYVDVLDKYKLDAWWWLVTPHSTKRHDNDKWVKCVSPHGNINNVDCGSSRSGVRPFLILKSDILVS